MHFIAYQPPACNPDVPARLWARRNAVSVALVACDRVPCPSGQLIAGDHVLSLGSCPIDLPEGACFPASVSVLLMRTNTGDWWGERNAAAIALISHEEPVRWSLIGAFGVDSAYACFVDASAYGHEQGAFTRGHKDGTLVPVPDSDGLAASVFMAGYGDGGYDVWLGVDQHDKPCMALIDFALDAHDSADEEEDF